MPPGLSYRAERLRELASKASEELEKQKKIQDEAWEKIEKSQQNRNCSLASWGAATLRELADHMINEKPLWTDNQVVKIEQDYVDARQYVIQFFPEWIEIQSPRSDDPEHIGDFKHKMLRVVGSNLKKIGLDDEYSQLEEHTRNVIRNAEAIAKGRQLIRDVQSWLTTHADANRVGKVNEIRALKEVGLKYARQLQGLAQRPGVSDITEIRMELLEFLKKIKKNEDEIMSRASALWETQIQTDQDIERIVTEVESLIVAFDNLPSDLEDLQIMREALRRYHNFYRQLLDENLSWDRFHKLAADFLNQCEEDSGEEESPWPPKVTLEAFVTTISALRERRSLEWITRVEEESVSIDDMEASEANRLHTKLSTLPSVLTPAHAEISNNILCKIEERLSHLSIEWLVEKFKELPQDNRIEFLRIVQRIQNV